MGAVLKPQCRDLKEIPFFSTLGWKHASAMADQWEEIVPSVLNHSWSEGYLHPLCLLQLLFMALPMKNISLSPLYPGPAQWEIHHQLLHAQSRAVLLTQKKLKGGDMSDPSLSRLFPLLLGSHGGPWHRKPSRKKYVPLRTHC
jgi:hypothetical protein